MKKWIIAAMLSLLAANLALADAPPCDMAARDKSVPAETRNKIAMACEKVKVISTCNKLADDRKLLGNTRNSFMQKCSGHVPAHRR